MMMVYSPAEDSWLLAENVPEPFGSKEFLDIGCGTGIIGINAARKGWHVTCTDLDPLAVKTARRNFEKEDLSGEFLVGDLFEPVKGRKFDVIAFNTPYLPTGQEDQDAENRIVWDGGKEGINHAVSTIKQAGGFLSEEGEIIILVSSLGNIKKLFRIAREQGYNVSIIACKKLFFEELLVLSFKKSSAENA